MQCQRWDDDYISNIKKDDFFLSQTLDEDENIWSLHDKSNVTLNEYLREKLTM